MGGGCAFQKAIPLSETAELMLGAGPSWSYSKGETGQTGFTFVADFMFWPWPERRFGWFLEPAYSHSFAREHEKSLAVSVGLLHHDPVIRKTLAISNCLSPRA